MERFLARYRPLITAVLSGFDRLVFRGSLLPLIMDGGMYTFLKRAEVRLLDFKDFVLATSERLKEASLREAVAHQRPIQYLPLGDHRQRGRGTPPARRPSRGRGADLRPDRPRALHEL